MEHLVENHLGGYYISNLDPEIIEEYCEECGDSDFILLSWEEENRQEVLNNYFLELHKCEDVIKTDFANGIPIEWMIDDLSFAYDTDRAIVRDLERFGYISNLEKISLLKMIGISQKKQFKLLKKISKEESNNKLVKKL